MPLCSPARIRLGLGLAALGVSALLSAQTAPAPLPKGVGQRCVSDAHTLCLVQGRFAVTAAFQQTPSGPSIEASAVSLTDETGYFWFFDASNIELVVKVLNACADFDSYWFFAAGLTNVGVAIVVKDLESGTMKVYDNPVGTPFSPIQDTSAFRTCP